MRLLACFCSLLASSGMTSAAPGSKEKPANPYYPMVAGASWEYEIQVPGRTSGVVEQVAIATDTKGGRLLTVTRTYQGDTIDLEKVEVSNRGVCRLWVAGRKLDDPEWMVKTPFKAGDTWTFTTNGPIPLKLSYTVCGEEDVEVPAGKYKAIRVDRAADGHPNFAASLWYAPGVGLIKSVGKYNDKGDRVQVLKSFTAGTK